MAVRSSFVTPALCSALGMDGGYSTHCWNGDVVKLELSPLVESIMEKKLSLKSAQTVFRIIHSKVWNVTPTPFVNEPILLERDL